MNAGIAALGKVVDCTILSTSFPGPLKHEILRDSVLNGIEDYFASDIVLVTLEGRQDVGKTRVVSQFAQRHNNSCVSLFVRPNSWFLQDPALVLSDLANQMHWALRHFELPSTTDIDEATVRHLSFELQRTGRATGQIFYFAIDGLDELVEESSLLCSTLASVLPLEYSSFRFLITGECGWLPNGGRLARKAYPISGFTIEETVAYLGQQSATRVQAEELYRNCSMGRPGYLASAKRLLDSGMTADKLLENLPEQLPNPFDIEWEKTDFTPEAIRLALGILCFDSTPHSLSELSALVSTDAEVLRSELERFGFVDVGTEGFPVSYVTTSYRRFASDKLTPIREAVWERLVTHFLEDRESERALEVLPTYLE
jgi:hypothetical protein